MKNIKHYIRHSLPIIVGLCVCLYLLFHILQGDRGLLSYPQRLRQLDSARDQLQTLETQKQIWEQKVALLRRDSLDLDMLEERARTMLNFTRPDEVVILYPTPWNDISPD